MKKNYLFVLFIGFLFISFSFTSCSKKNDHGLFEQKSTPTGKIIKSEKFGYVPANIIDFTLKDGFNNKDAEKIAAELGGKITAEVELINFFEVETTGTTESDLLSALEKVRSKQEVEFASHYVLMIRDESCNPFDDPLYNDNAVYTKNNELIGVKQACDIIKAAGLKKSNVKVGILDDPVNINSDELKGKSKIHGIDKGDETTQDDLNHGTEIALIIGANPDNGGMTGISSGALEENLEIIVENMDYNNFEYPKLSTPDTDDVTKYVDHFGQTLIKTEFVKIMGLIKNDAKIINLSYGPGTYSDYNDFQTQIYTKFYNKIAEKYPDVIFVNSAGNQNTMLNGKNGENKGQKLPNVITVGALTGDGDKADFSNFGSNDAEVTLSAPGKNIIFGKDKNGNDITGRGTSYAAPHVTAALAILKSLKPSLNAAELKNLLVSTVEKNPGYGPYNPTMGAGCLRIDRAVLQLVNEIEGNNPPLKLEDYLNRSQVGLKAEGGPTDFKITADIKAMKKGSTDVIIEMSGNNFLLKGDSKKTLSSPGSVTWEVTLTDPINKVTVKVKRLDTDGCATVLIGGELKPEDLAGVWKGSITYDDWSTPYKIAEAEIQKNMIGGKGAPLTLTINAKFLGGSNLNFALSADGGLPMPSMEFTYSDFNLISNTTSNSVTYNYSATVKQEGNDIKLSGTWKSNATNGSLKMNGKWNATKPYEPK